MVVVRVSKEYEMTVATDTQIFDIGEAANFLNIKKYTLYRLVKNGKVPGTKIGGQWRFSRAVLEELFRNSSSNGTTENPLTE